MKNDFPELKFTGKSTLVNLNGVENESIRSTILTTVRLDYNSIIHGFIGDSCDRSSILFDFHDAVEIFNKSIEGIEVEGGIDEVIRFIMPYLGKVVDEGFETNVLLTRHLVVDIYRIAHLNELSENHAFTLASAIKELANEIYNAFWSCDLIIDDCGFIPFVYVRRLAPDAFHFTLIPNAFVKRTASTDPYDAFEPMMGSIYLHNRQYESRYDVHQYRVIKDTIDGKIAEKKNELDYLLMQRDIINDINAV